MSTIVADSASYADVNTAVNTTAERNDTVQIPAGDVDWEDNLLTLTKPVRLTGPGSSLLTIRHEKTAIRISPDPTAVANDEVIAVLGINFDNELEPAGGALGAEAGFIEIWGPTTTKPWRGLMIGKNKFTRGGNHSTVIYCHGQVRGVIYLNEFDRCDFILRAFSAGTVAEWNNGEFPFAFGNQENLFFENNLIHWPQVYDGFSPGWSEFGQGGRGCLRYNVYNCANITAGGVPTQIELLDSHGFQNWTSGVDGNGQTGTMITEFYGNLVTNYAGGTLVKHRGSWGAHHNNIVAGTGTAYIIALHYGSGCPEMVDDWNETYDTRINTTYCWNNLINGVINPMYYNLAGPWHDFQCDGTLGEVEENGEWWNYNAAFDGTVGIGRGTAAPGGTATVGVGYWQNATPTPSTDPAIVQLGKLWRALATDVWTDDYTPYTYPHPLRVLSAPVFTAPSTLSGTAKVGAVKTLTFAVDGDPTPTLEVDVFSCPP